ncbi:glutathione S-transferase [Robbsia andropogonis]|uniref:Glutathione S-transferase n=1 Tax=Robbsia andropogonis TaxID=28092 RepID=A0A0F5K067_9BURK|nr:glutathione S-transferase [Robbsia andropogonis]KKB62957.1 glutathione S-transferase [Robbsia andropogonis]MCP1120283.1 glutathione S-transferase [Robbsia andropogonis]MCP1130153.1 glutathione S-transferase [Robbsia andropogonis]
MIKILGKSSSINVRKVLWTCTELDIPYDHEEWGEGHKPVTSPEFLALNPMAQVPVLIDGELITSESNSIIRYLASKYDPSRRLLPQTGVNRAQIERWMDWQATELNNAWRYPFMHLVRAHPDFAYPDIVARSIEKWTDHMALIDSQLRKTQAFLLGAEFSLADIVIGLSVHRWYATPIDHPAFDAVRTYYARLEERKGFRAFGNNGKP